MQSREFKVITVNVPIGLMGMASLLALHGNPAMPESVNSLLGNREDISAYLEILKARKTGQWVSLCNSEERGKTARI